MALWTNVDETSGKPKYLSSTEKSNTVGINAQEAAANGLTAGWNLKTTGSGGRSGRVFHEVLVAMGSMTGDNDTIAPEITITAQPTNQSVTEPAAATFSVTATRTGTGTLTYLWQVSTDSGSTWNTASGAVATNSSFTIDPTEVAMDGHQYRCLVSLAGADTKTSNAVTLSVTA